ncbi:MAG TPA: hypothetical protein VGE74_08345 [Gemmata sp.]
MNQAFAPYLWRALRRLRESAPLQRLSRLTSPGEFIDQMFFAAGRNLAVASGFLPAEVRNEGRIAFLCCRALDAHEDLNPDPELAAQRILEVAAFLCGRSTVPPPVPTGSGDRASDRLEALVAARLPWLRAALVALPAPQRERVEALIDDLARAMSAHARTPHLAGAAPAPYGVQVLGRVVRYALALMRVEVAPTVDPDPIGRLCQAVNDLRDLPDDMAAHSGGGDPEGARSALWLELAETAAVASSVLRDLRFTGTAGARGALVYMAATTLKAVARQAGFPLPWVTRHPLGAALLASAGHRAYRRALLQVDRTVLGVMVHRSQVPCPGTAPPAAPHGWGQDEFEAALADQHPDPALAAVLKRSCRLFRCSLLLTRGLPPVPLSSRRADGPDGPLLMLSDYLMATAITGIERAGLPVLAHFCRACGALVDERQNHPGQTDPTGHLAAFLAATVGAARGLPPAEVEKRCRESRERSRRLHRADEPRPLVQTLKTYLFG